jgi:hypothetical protein
MAVWIALALLLVAVVAGVAVALYRGICLWRLAKRTGRVFDVELERISSAAAEIEEQLARADASTARLSEAAERLRRSRARLDVQLAAVREARGQVARVFWFVPGL